MPAASFSSTARRGRRYPAVTVSTLFSLLFVLLSGCAALAPVNDDSTSTEPPVTQEEKEQSATTVAALFEEFYQSEIDGSPVLRSRLGYSGQFEWDDISAEAQEERTQRYQSLRSRLKAIREEALDYPQRWSYRILLNELEQRLLMVPFHSYDYAYSQLGGWHTEVVNVLVNNHPVSSIPDLHDYISRLKAIPGLFKRWEENIRAAAADGIIPPAFVYPAVKSSIRNIISGAPFTDSGESPLWRDFNNKLDQLNLYPANHELLQRKARSALLNQVGPAYRQLLAVIEEQEKQAPAHMAASDHAEGMRYYQLLLGQYSNSHLDAETLYQLGLTEVSRIQQQIRVLAPALGYTGPADAPMQSVFAALNKTDSHYPDTPQGRDEFIGFQKKRLHEIAARLPYYFTDLPATPVAIQLVEDYRAINSPIAFYEAPSADGQRPGIYYINPQRIKDLPRSRLPALLYHEALPGHHLQVATAQENDRLPDFRRILHYPAFSEGWALYAEKLAADIGAYKTPQERYGQLVMELWRAVRLVLDTGLNAKGWSREQALQYRLANTPFSRADSEAAINRYLVMPGQAVAYKMGELKIEKIRQRAEDELGRNFDPAAFHSALLANGAVPLDVLEDVMQQWADGQAKTATSRPDEPEANTAAPASAAGNQ
ncbi:MAG: hypothetical protein CMI02_19270 [Oceanospirillaceae bacterium]|nr:hypothetical protein [Oceanospirillaceae bacterium]